MPLKLGCRTISWASTAALGVAQEADFIQPMPFIALFVATPGGAAAGGLDERDVWKSLPSLVSTTACIFV